MAAQTGLGKSKDRHTRNLLRREWQVGKVSNLENEAGVSSEISNELACRGNTVHASMYNVETCACYGR